MSFPDQSPKIRNVCDERFCPKVADCQLFSAIQNIEAVDSPFTDDEKRSQLEVLRINKGFKNCRLYPIIFPNQRIL
jgi:hypothetical protein